MIPHIYAIFAAIIFIACVPFLVSPSHRAKPEPKKERKCASFTRDQWDEIADLTAENFAKKERDRRRERNDKVMAKWQSYMAMQEAMQRRADEWAEKEQAEPFPDIEDIVDAQIEKHGLDDPVTPYGHPEIKRIDNPTCETVDIDIRDCELFVSGAATVSTLMTLKSYCVRHLLRIRRIRITKRQLRVLQAETCEPRELPTYPKSYEFDGIRIIAE